MAEQKFSSSQGYMIGGPGLTVEVDESMFGNRFFAKLFIFLLLLGKRKYRRGRISGRRQMWVLGGVVGICFTILQINLMIKIRMIKIFTVKNINFLCSETRECFLEECPNNKRDRETLEKLILKRARLGTKILTDGWDGYKQLEKLGLFILF